MKALDTNVLVRFLVGDDEAMAARTEALFNEAKEQGNRLVVTTPVILELLWVLQARYRLTREDILDALDKLARMPVLELDSHDRLRELVLLGRTTRFDLADILIGLYAKDLGCTATLTLDRNAARSDLFEEIG